MSIELHCKACDLPFDEHDGLVETCRKLMEAEKAQKALADTLRQLVATAMEIEEMHSEAWPELPCVCDHGHDGRMPRRGPICVFCATKDHFKKLAAPYKPNA